MKKTIAIFIITAMMCTFPGLGSVGQAEILSNGPLFDPDAPIVVKLTNIDFTDNAYDSITLKINNKERNISSKDVGDRILEYLVKNLQFNEEVLIFPTLLDKETRNNVTKELAEDFIDAANEGRAFVSYNEENRTYSIDERSENNTNTSGLMNINVDNDDLVELPDVEESGFTLGEIVYFILLVIVLLILIEDFIDWAKKKVE